MNRNVLNKIMNSIVIDFLILSFIITICLLIFGNFKENGDINAGSMYGLFIIPLIPIIVIALGMIQIAKNSLAHKINWLGHLTPLSFLILIFWLSNFQTQILFSTLILTITYSFLKRFI